MTRAAPWFLIAPLLFACDDGRSPSDDAGPIDLSVTEPDAAVGCARNIDCLAAEYCDREAPMEDSDAEPPLGTCVAGCRLEPDNCPVGRGCHPDMRVCVGDCICEAGAVDGCDGERLRVCADDCFGFEAEACPGEQRCMGGECRDRPMPMPDMAPSPEPDMTPPPERDMSPPEQDMTPPEQDMAPLDPDMAPLDRDMAP